MTEAFIGQKHDQASGMRLPCRWLVSKRYMWTWRALGHHVVRPAREEDGSLPIKANGQPEWAVPLTRAIKSHGKADASAGQALPPPEATSPVDGGVPSDASAEPVAKKRRRRAVSS